MIGELLLMVTLLHRAQGQGAPPQENRIKAIERREEELALAFNRFDAAALDRLWGDDLAFVFPNGTLATKAERLASLKSRPQNVPTSTNESVDVKIYGDVAVAIVVSKWNVLSDGKPSSLRFRATHVWSKTGDQWRLVSAHVSQMKD